MTQVLAADIGGTNIRAALVSADGTMSRAMHTQIELGDRHVTEDQLIQRLTVFFSDLLDKAPAVKAIGIGFPGFFIGNSGLLVASPNLPNLHHVELAEKLGNRLGISVHVQNDALCAAIGEQTYGAGKGSANLLHITLGTGVGGGLILNGTPYTGENGMAMEFGHLRVDHEHTARSCGCGGQGCVETYASATAIATSYFEHSGTHSESKEIYEHACEGDHHAVKVIETAGHYLGIAIAQAIKLLDIQTVTVSGGLTGAWPILQPAIMTSLNAELIAPLKNKIRVLRSSLDDTAGILGAAALTRI